MDLSNIEGLTPEQIEAITAAHDADVQGLKAKTEELLGEKKTIQQSAQEKEQALEEARKAAKEAEAKKLEAQGEYEKAQKLREEERAKLVAEAEANANMYKQTLEKYEVDKVKNSILSRVTESQKPFVDAMLDKCISTEMKDGAVITSLSYGDNQFSSADDFINGVSEDKAWQSVLRGANSSGAGSTNTGASGGASAKGDFTKMSMAEKIARIESKQNL